MAKSSGHISVSIAGFGILQRGLTCGRDINMNTAVNEALFVESFFELQKHVYEMAKKKGFHSSEGNVFYVPTKLGLIMSEAVEAMEAHRAGKLEDVPHELADIVIRCMDLAHSLGIDLASNIVTKVHINEKRPFMHDGKLY